MHKQLISSQSVMCLIQRYGSNGYFSLDTDIMDIFFLDEERKDILPG